MGDKKGFFLTVILTAIISFCAAYLCMMNYVYSVDELGRLRNVINIIKRDYIGEFDVEKAEENAIDAVVAGIGDKYAAYYNEESAKEVLNDIEGFFVGIGLEVFANTEENRLEVIAAYDGTPAQRAGIKPGDILHEIDGKNYGAENLAQAALYMRGNHLKKPIDSELTITVLRGEEKIEMKLKREKIAIDRVNVRLVDDICYIRYSGFAENATKLFEEEIKKLDESKVSGIVVDLRDNPGGELASTIKMCDMFLDDGMIMYTVDNQKKKEVYNADKKAYNYPLAVLINGASASASEIFAGSMQARKRAVIVGEKSFGKGVAQTMAYINVLSKADGALKLTTCKNYRPDGIWLNEGVTPDIEVVAEIKDISKIENDEAFKAAVKELKK